MWGWGGGDVIHKLEMQGRTKKDLVVSKIRYRILKILNIREVIIRKIDFFLEIIS